MSKDEKSPKSYKGRLEEIYEAALARGDFNIALATATELKQEDRGDQVKCFDINCHKCKESLQIGQDDFIYESDGGLDEFLYKHNSHPLTFERSDKNQYSKFESMVHESI